MKRKERLERKRLKEEEDEFREKYSFSRRIPTPDDWSPAFIDNPNPGHFAECRMHVAKTLDGGLWVNVFFSGNDDFCISKRKRFGSLEAGLLYFEQKVSWASKLAFASWKDLLKLGFDYE